MEQIKNQFINQMFIELLVTSPYKYTQDWLSGSQSRSDIQLQSSNITV